MWIFFASQFFPPILSQEMGTLVMDLCGVRARKMCFLCGAIVSCMWMRVSDCAIIAVVVDED